MLCFHVSQRLQSKSCYMFLLIISQEKLITNLVCLLCGPFQKHVLPLVREAKHTPAGDTRECKGSPGAVAGEYGKLNSWFC